MAKYLITYETTATLTYLVDAASEEEAQRSWQNETPLDFDQADFVEGAAGTPALRLTRLEMLEPAWNFEIQEATKHQAIPAR
jgi:hypothetical protein